MQKEMWLRPPCSLFLLLALVCDAFVHGESHDNGAPQNAGRESWSRRDRMITDASHHGANGWEAKLHESELETEVSTSMSNKTDNVPQDGTDRQVNESESKLYNLEVEEEGTQPRANHIGTELESEPPGKLEQDDPDLFPRPGPVVDGSHHLKMPDVRQSSSDNMKAHKPNIIFTVVDDLGFGDLGNKVKQIETPVIDGLMKRGVELTNYYVLSSCSPSRAAFMTGRYPIRYGVNKVLGTFKPEGVPLTERFLSQTLKAAGYRTHAVGKWHLGFHRWEYTPTFRGFESFHGSYSGKFGYYNYSYDFKTAWNGHSKHEAYYDLHEAVTERCGLGCSKIVDHRGIYSTDYFAAVAVSIIKDHNPSQPLFMYLAFQAVHEPIEAPDWHIAKYRGIIENKDRLIYAGMLDAVDEAVFKVVQQLRKSGIYDRTLFIFTSDNGGPTEMCGRQGSSNWPLRGGKCTVWEGGTRSPAFISGAGVPRQLEGQTYSGLMHAVDWLPTLAHVAGASVGEHQSLDGINQWQAMTSFGSNQHPREEMFYGIGNNIQNNGVAIKQGDWKLMVGSPGAGLWSKLPNATTGDAVLEIRSSVPSSADSHFPHGWKGMTALYRLSEDPQELHDLMATQPDIATDLRNRLKVYLSIHSIHVEDAVDEACQDSKVVAPIDIGPAGMAAAVPWCRVGAESLRSTSRTRQPQLSEVQQNAAHEQSRKLHGSIDPMLCKLKDAVSSSTDGFKSMSDSTDTLSKHFGNCAVVSSSGVMLLHEHGKEIDAADLVIRFNSAPTSGFEKQVGERADIRMVNEKVLDEWFQGSNRGVLNDQTVYASTCAVCEMNSESPVSTEEFQERQSRLLWQFPSLQLFSSDLRLEKALMGFFQKLYGVHFTNAGVTSGTVGMALALGMCDKVFAYGMAAGPNDGGSVPYSYWEGDSKDIDEWDATSNSTQKWHASFHDEKELWRQVAVNPAEDVESSDVAIIPGFHQFECTKGR